MSSTIVFAQDVFPVLPKAKRFIDKLEVFAGPNLSFNYGNKFIEIFKDQNVINKRLLKAGYAFGIGAYHPLSNRLDLNVRLQYEQKGTRSEVNTPTYPDGNRDITYSDYSYRYLTILALPQLVIGRKKRIVLSLGSYYSRIKAIDGNGKTYDTNGTYYSEGSYEGRYFDDLRDDGTRQGFSWMPYLSSIEEYDIGIVASVGYRVPIKRNHTINIQLQDSFGLKNINKNNPYDLEEKNHSVTLSIAYILKLPSKK